MWSIIKHKDEECFGLDSKWDAEYYSKKEDFLAVFEGSYSLWGPVGDWGLGEGIST